MSGDAKKDLKCIQELSGSILVIEALSQKDLTKTVELISKIELNDDEYVKVINEYLPTEANDYITKLRNIDMTKKYFEIFKVLVPLLNELQHKLLMGFKEKNNNKDLNENELFVKKYTTDLNKTPLGEDNPIMLLDDIEKSYEEFIDEINNTPVVGNNNIYQGLYINNLKKTVEEVVSKDEYKNNIKDIKNYLSETLYSYDYKK
jgi:hypothetical protein